ncbi:Glutathione S-transferase TCHQD [Trichinella spiralis]|uniref:Glutathione S-transferase TCHQD n=1 Tax=Trichinella spiralis TaxID=6334 RepID=A0ABR3K4V8_TRISP
MSGHLEKFEKSLSEKYSRNVVILCQEMPNKYVALAVHVAAKGINRELPIEKIVDRIVEACTRAKGILIGTASVHQGLALIQNKAEYVNYGIDPFTGYKIDPSVGYFGLDPYTGLTIFPASRQRKVVPQNLLSRFKNVNAFFCCARFLHVRRNIANRIPIARLSIFASQYAKNVLSALPHIQLQPGVVVTSNAQRTMCVEMDVAGHRRIFSKQIVCKVMCS